jgi:hypothetical protein
MMAQNKIYAALERMYLIQDALARRMLSGLSGLFSRGLVYMCR